MSEARSPASSGGSFTAALEVRGLSVEFQSGARRLRAVDDVSFSVHPGEVLGVVGESGSGKSVTFLALSGLLPDPPGKVVAGAALLAGDDLLTMSPRELRAVRGKRIAMVFQDPMSSLNPVLTVGWQLEEALRLHEPHPSRRAARERSIELLQLVGIPDAARRHRHHPHQFSGGMRQRVMIAMAIANDPAVLVADEPTTALDVTVQAQVLEVLESVRTRLGAATVLITHDLGLVAERVDRVLVMYAGRVVEQGDVTDIFHAPAHPYTRGLLASLPRVDRDIDELPSIDGSPPSLADPPSGCRFHPRCSHMRGRARCRDEVPSLREVQGRLVACHFAEDVVGEPPRPSSSIDGDRATAEQARPW